ncbi:MAG: hypothetical protein HUU02_12545 [Bacteroidetes bacterium]|nr:hypothetical protein [Bacteroidota bacterium]
MKLIILILSFFLIASGQEPIDDVMESAAASEEESVIREAADQLEELRRSPVNVTRPSYGDLLRIPFISPMLAESIILFTDTVKVEDIAQLNDAALMTPEMFERIAPFITVAPRVSASSVLIPQRFELRSRVEGRRQTTQGFLDSRYDGTPFSEYQRIEIEGGTYRALFLRERDPGESTTRAFAAGSVQFSKLPLLDRVVAGTFSVSSAQGLILARSMSASKGSDAAGQAVRRSSGVTSTVSADEFRYFNGGGFRTSVGPFALSGFASFRRLPASVDSSGTVTSFYTSGLFRNGSELQRRDRTAERTIGSILEYRPLPSALITLNAVQVRYERPIRTTSLSADPTRPLTAASIGWDLPVSGLRFFGEAAGNGPQQIATAAGLLIPVGQRFSMVYHHRSMPARFRSPFGRPFAERTPGVGEHGDYLGMEFTLGRTRFSAFVDQFRFPAAAPELPSSGIESFIGTEIPLSRGTKAQLQYRHRSVNGPVPLTSEKIRAGFSAAVNSTLTILHRIERVTVHSGQGTATEYGILAFSELRYRQRDDALMVRTRLIWFDAPSYASRLYQYETDVPGNVSNPPLYGSGFRWYVVLRWNVADGCWLSGKYGETMKLHETSLGSGDDMISGAVDGRFAVQLDFLL